MLLPTLPCAAQKPQRVLAAVLRFLLHAVRVLYSATPLTLLVAAASPPHSCGATFRFLAPTTFGAQPLFVGLLPVVTATIVAATRHLPVPCGTTAQLDWLPR